LADTSTRSSLLGSELEELLRTTPPLATRRHHDLPENQAWLARAAGIVDRWDSSRSAAFAELYRQFHGRNAHEASDAFEQMVVLLRQAEYDLRIRDEAPLGVYGRPLFQGLSYHDTPEGPPAALEMRYVDVSAKPGEKHTYSILTINSAGVVSDPFAAVVIPSAESVKE